MQVKFTPNKMTTIIIFLIACYFIYHTITGQRGILAMIELNAELDKYKQELETAKFERMMIEHKVKLMSSESLDLDLVEQQARQILGMADPRENVIIVE